MGTRAMYVSEFVSFQATKCLDELAFSGQAPVAFNAMASMGLQYSTQPIGFAHANLVPCAKDAMISGTVFFVFSVRFFFRSPLLFIFIFFTLIESYSLV